MSEIIFRTHKLGKQYKKFDITAFKRKKITALKDFDMEIHKGDIYGFVGANGAGKTTLMRILAGLVSWTEGEIELFGGKDAKTLCRQRSRINGIIETPAINLGLTAWDNLEICRIQRGISDRERISRALEEAGLQESDIRKVKTKDFSLGMKQRLSIAQALLSDAEFLFFDEPFNGLDPGGVKKFSMLIKNLNKERGITVLISSHQLSELDRLATCYGFIHKGKMLEQVSANDLKDKFNRYMLIKVDNVPETERILRTAFSVDKLEIVSEDTINLYEQMGKGSEIMKALVLAGVNVEEMAVKGENLKKYYLSLIKNA